MDEHPGEDVIVKGRILGGLMPTEHLMDSGTNLTRKRVKVVGGSYEQGNAATALMLSALSAGRAVPDRDRIRHIPFIPRVKSRRYRDDITINVAYFDHSNGMIDFSTDLDTDSAGDTHTRRKC
ncbi:hypothetical protein BSLG_005898 [Batrachochytrium salamandrivorans]|nr:hypothetical protein BSLG_005898 [Batrachochytrium salamandrivorans]